MPRDKMILFRDAEIRPVVTEAEARQLLEKFDRDTDQWDRLVAQNDWQPEDGDYIMVPFRLISATIVAAYSYRASDFTKPGVLQQSMKLLLNKPVMINHSSDVRLAIGTIESVQYTDAKTQPDGTLVPGGIDGLLKIDAKGNPGIARAILSNPPRIQSNSVTVVYDWTPSHEFSDEWEFKRLVGKVIDSNGKSEMVRRIVTSIVNYEETSLVYMGADPYAKVKMPDGTYLNIDHSGIYGINEQALSKIEEANNLMITTESMTKTNMTSNQDQAVQVDKMPASDKDQLQKFEAALAELSKVKAEALSLQLAVDAAKAEALETSQKCEQLRAEIKTFTDSLIAAQKESESLRTEVTQLKPLAAAGTEALDQLRMEAARLMQLSYNGKAPQRLLEDLSKLDTVADLSKAVEAYGGKAYAQFDAKCANCGSQNITLRSSADTPDEGTPQPTAAPSPLSRLVHGF